ncbi:MAG: SGNH/GDSL hydrolase family protein [Clostridia bacterium]|nr:SGNH/GDSL hydrolase family protein [Clostridia bacterium]
MKKVTLLGDSIRLIGYGTKVPELLGSNYEVLQPTDNCRFCKYTLRGVSLEWKNLIKDRDVIHWNNGLWDFNDLGDGVFTTSEEYIETMVRIAKILKANAKTVIFATTTPVRPENAHHDNDRIKRYNDLIVPVLSDMGIIINDLYSTVYPHIDSYIRSDDLIHLTDEGIAACSKQVADIIKSAI